MLVEPLYPANLHTGQVTCFTHTQNQGTQPGRGLGVRRVNLRWTSRPLVMRGHGQKVTWISQGGTVAVLWQMGHRLVLPVLSPGHCPLTAGQSQARQAHLMGFRSVGPLKGASRPLGGHDTNISVTGSSCPGPEASGLRCLWGCAGALGGAARELRLLLRKQDQ